MSPSDFKNKRVTLTGLGLHGGGVALARWLLRHGARLTVTDLKTAKELAPSVAAVRRAGRAHFVLGRHRKADFTNADLVIQNPGVPKESPYIRAAERADVPVENEASLFFQMCPAPIIGVSGTRGKSTTTRLIFEMLRAAKIPAVFGGNIREVAMFDLLDRVRAARRKPWVVLELSSWHLERFPAHRLHPRVAVLTSIFPDHLNRYRGMKEYIAAKENLTRFQGPDDVTVVNRDNAETRKLGKRVPGGRLWFSAKSFPEENGAFVRGGAMVVREDGKETRVCAVKDIMLPGAHNVMNVLAAATAAKAVGVPNAAIRSALRRFRGLPHRLEFVREVRGIKFYNDTAATSPDAAIAALRTFAGEKVILIAGGSDKNLQFGALAKAIQKYAKEVVLLPGSATEKLQKALHRKARPVSSMREAVRAAVSAAQEGDIVLLSPGAASFGLFKHEFDRGDQFVRAVRALR
ncbi:MAG: UDP-N-acetylmuramoyl-L-alanine--D-glutamate ligase [Patescibacteria group bacterium]